jgi:hypothetical protein
MHFPIFSYVSTSEFLFAEQIVSSILDSRNETTSSICPWSFRYASLANDLCSSMEFVQTLVPGYYNLTADMSRLTV